MAVDYEMKGMAPDRISPNLPPDLQGKDVEGRLRLQRRLDTTVKGGTEQR
jgi:hypothetical protein